MDRIDIRATKLEAYRTCPYKYKYEPPLDGESDALKFWTALHKYIELLLVNKINDITEQLVFDWFGIKQRLMIIRMANLFKDKIEEKWYELIVSERKTNTLFEELNIELQWTFDHLFRNKEWKLIIVDAKTTKAKRTEEHKLWVRQNVIYPGLVKLKYMIDIDYFEYWTMTKTSNPVLEDICFEITWDPIADIAVKLQELRNSETTNFFPPKYPNFSCRYCKLKNECKNFKW